MHGKQCGENICRYGLNKMFTAIHWVDHLKEITKVITHIRKSNLIYITCGNYFRDLVDFLTTIYISDYIFFFGI